MRSLQNLAFITLFGILCFSFSFNPLLFHVFFCFCFDPMFISVFSHILTLCCFIFIFFLWPCVVSCFFVALTLCWFVYFPLLWLYVILCYFLLLWSLLCGIYFSLHLKLFMLQLIYTHFISQFMHKYKTMVFIEFLIFQDHLFLLPR